MAQEKIKLVEEIQKEYSGYSIGFRAWQIGAMSDGIHEEPALLSRVTRTTTPSGHIVDTSNWWVPQEEIVANCPVYSTNNPYHKVPVTGCSCGLYAYFSLKDLLKSLNYFEKGSVLLE